MARGFSQGAVKKTILKMIILDELQSSHLQTLELDNFAVSHVLGTLSHHIEPLSRIYLGHNFSQRGKKSLLPLLF